MIEQHGDGAQAHVIGRMRHFAMEADDDGIRFWADISRRIHDLTTASSVQ